MNKTAHQAEDNVAHLTYYNSAANVSFVWNGTQGNMADICPGGYAEPVRGKLVLSRDYSNLTVAEALRSFKNECEVFLLSVSIRDDEDAIDICGKKYNTYSRSDHCPEEPTLDEERLARALDAGLAAMDDEWTVPELAAVVTLEYREDTASKRD